MSLDDGYRRIGADPFLPPVEERDPPRRLRGRLATPVTVWTAYDGAGVPAGITVSSVLVVEGEPAQVVGLLGPLSDFWGAVQATKRFVLHVLGAGDVRTSELFALRYPGDPFEELSVTAGDWGPVLDGCRTSASCSLTGYLEVGPGVLARGVMDEVEAADEPPLPLVHYRGKYLTVGPRPA